MYALATMAFVGMQPVLTHVPPEQVPFNNRDRHAGARQTPGERRPGLAGADNDRVVPVIHCMDSISRERPV